VTAILDSLGDPAILLDGQHHILAANRAYRAAFQGGPEIVGRHCYEISHCYSVPCSLAGESCPLQRCAETGAPARDLHVHPTLHGEEHHDVEIRPVLGTGENLFLEIIHPVEISIPRPAGGTEELVGRSPDFIRALDLVRRAAPRETPVLLLGESGTGKEIVARAIHRLSPRCEKPFVPVDCAGLQETLFESELFGHEKGAFTGAVNRREGLVESAGGGTLFLDEVGDIPLALQVKLLRLLETGTFRRVGSTQLRRADFRLVCATHRDLQARMEAGTFRRDLYYRISAFPVVLPPLRERPEDLAPLAEALLRRLGCGERCHLHAETLEALGHYGFPGNVRELLNILERSCLLADDGTIRPEHLPVECLGRRCAPSLPSRSAIQPLEAVERQYLRWALARFQGSREQLARKLGLSERTLYRKLQTLEEEGPPRGPVTECMSRNSSCPGSAETPAPTH
jgi:transcriptional regulator with PAS, ATPase and Fis domain